MYVFIQQETNSWKTVSASSFRANEKIIIFLISKNYFSPEILIEQRYQRHIHKTSLIYLLKYFKIIKMLISYLERLFQI